MFLRRTLRFSPYTILLGQFLAVSEVTILQFLVSFTTYAECYSITPESSFTATGNTLIHFFGTVLTSELDKFVHVWDGTL